MQSIKYTILLYKNSIMDTVMLLTKKKIYKNRQKGKITNAGELGYDGPLYDRFLHMTHDMLGPSLMRIKYSSYVYDGFCI